MSTLYEWLGLVIIVAIIVLSAVIELGRRGTQRDDFRRGGKYNR